MAIELHRGRGGIAVCMLALAGVLGTGCTEGATSFAPGAARSLAVEITEEPPRPRDPDGLFENPALRQIVELQLRRDGAALLEHLDAESATVRARAALALASVQWPEAAGSLEARLEDPDPGVRRDAAFALGQLPSPTDGSSLLRALARETDPEVRLRVIEALGKVGDARSLGELSRMAPGPNGSAPERDSAGPETAEEERALALAVGRALVRGVEVQGGVSALVAWLQHEDPAVREAAAWYFGRTPDTPRWADQVGALRSVLDRAGADDPSAMHLLVALARNRSADDRERLLHWLGNSSDWRNRASAARGLGHVSWIEREGVREGLFRALEDPMEQVAIIAARSLTQGLWVPPHVLARMEGLLREDPPDRWRVHVPFLRQVSQFGDAQAVVEWTRRAMDTQRGAHPLAVANGLAALAEAGVSEMDSLLIRAVSHPDPEFRTVGVSALAGSWEGMVVRGTAEADIQRYLLTALEQGPAPAAVYAAPILAHPAFADLGASEDALHEAGWRWLERGELHASGVLARSLSELGDARGEALASAVGAAAVNLAPDWDFLAALGSYPRLLVETNRGDIVVRLAAEEAPLTVQGLARLAEAGRHDGVILHRLEPNFVIQGGDVAMADGSGFPGIRLPSEFTTIPFRRGTLGMASLGKDTEGSQFFLTHSMQPHLDGAFTSFGWVESGFDVMDRLGVGDRVVRLRVEPDPGVDG